HHGTFLVLILASCPKASEGSRPESEHDGLTPYEPPVHRGEPQPAEGRAAATGEDAGGKPLAAAGLLEGECSTRAPGPPEGAQSPRRRVAEEEPEQEARRAPPAEAAAPLRPHPPPAQRPRAGGAAGGAGAAGGRRRPRGALRRRARRCTRRHPLRGRGRLQPHGRQR
ncbi:unnamed protein product, partial [Prorocentrum cordatum]